MIDLTNRIGIVTGATDGIGQVTARELARLGATVVIFARNESKARCVVAAFQAATGNVNVEYLIADLSSLSDIRKAAETFRAKYDRLHILVNNAGLFIARRRVSLDGYEMMFAVNHLAHFLLTNLLLDTIKASGTPENPARIVNVASKMHFNVTLDFDDLQSEKRYKPMEVYAKSKLANILFTYELARRLTAAGAPVTVNAAHPGFVNTGIGKDPDSLLGWGMRFGLFFVRWMQIPPEKGARTSIYLATAPEVATISGQYFEKGQAVPSSAASLVESDWARLWTISEKLVCEK